METGKAVKKAEITTPAAATGPAAPKSKKKPSLNFHAIFKKPNKNAKPEGQSGDAPAAPGADAAHPRDSEETVVITDELPEKKVSSENEDCQRSFSFNALK